MNRLHEGLIALLMGGVLLTPVLLVTTMLPNPQAPVAFVAHQH